MFNDIVPLLPHFDSGLTDFQPVNQIAAKRHEGRHMSEAQWDKSLQDNGRCFPKHLGKMKIDGKWMEIANKRVYFQKVDNTKYKSTKLSFSKSF